MTLPHILIPLALSAFTVAATAWADTWPITAAACLICWLVAKTVVETWRLE